MANEAGELDATVAQAFRKARRAVLLAFVVSGVVIALLLGERILALEAMYGAARDAREVADLNGQIMLSDEILTMSAMMAVHSDDPRWRARYQSEIDEMDRHIARALAIAPPEIADDFDNDTRLSNDALVNMEWEALELAALGDDAAARAVFDRISYQRFKRLLANGSAGLSGSLRRTFDQRVVDIRQEAMLMTVALGGTTLILFVFLFRMFKTALGVSRTAHCEAASRIATLATSDPVTGLMNLQAFRGAVTARLGRDRDCAVAVVTLRNSARLRERVGLATFEGAMHSIAERLTSITDQDGVLAYIATGEFALLPANGTTADDLEEQLISYLDALLLPVSAAGALIRISAGTGYAMASDMSAVSDPEAVNELLRKAAAAANSAASNQSDWPLAHTRDMDRDQQRQARLSAQLPDAIRNGDVKPYFQPIVDLSHGGLSGFEVLARWEHDEHGIIGPDVFIPLAIEDDLINDLFQALLHDASKAAAAWPDPIWIAINLSPGQTQSPDMADRILETLAGIALPPRRLMIEITEDAMVSDISETTRFIQRLKTEGIKIALDDFGTGYSSLHNLQLLPFDRIKVDRSFVTSMLGDRDAHAIVQSIVGLGRSMDLPVTAEGVETADIADVLRSLGCTHAQGWHFGKPVPAVRATAMIMRDCDRPAEDDAPFEAGGPLPARQAAQASA